MTTRKNQKRTEKDYKVQKTVETMKVLEALELVPASIKTIIERIGYVPNLKGKSNLSGTISYDAARRILLTLKLLGYASQDEITERWSKGYKSF